MNVLIEVAISMIVVFLLLSLATTAVTEAIASVLKTRARNLRRVLQNLLTDDAVRAAFYRHPLISTFRAPGDSGDQTPQTVTARNHPSYVATACFAKALHRAVLEAQGMDATAPAQSTVSGFRNTAAKIEDETLRTAVLALVDSASDNLEDTKAVFSAWFDNAMDQLSGQFKRQQQVISFAVAVILAAVLNLNIFELSNDLIENDARRLAFVEFAETQVPQEDVANFFAQTPDEADQQPSGPFAALTDLGLGHDDFHLKTICEALSKPLNWLSWFVAGFASILGAPFWFDLLKRFVNIRGSGVRPQNTSN